MPFCTRTVSWDDVLTTVREHIPASNFQTWLQPTSLISVSDERLEVGVANRFAGQWLAQHYRDELTNAIAAHYDIRPEIVFTVAAEPANAETAGAPAAKDTRPTSQRPAATSLTASAAGGAVELPTQSRGLNAAYTLDAFVAGSANRLAHAACLRAVEKPGEYTPLFIHSAPGLGKTHLLQAIAQANPLAVRQTRVRYLSAEAFVSEYLASLQARNLESFRRRMRACDIFLLDDVQIIGRGNKVATQEELLHTIDALLNLGKQVVIAADRAPAAIDGLHEGLVNRFGAGLIARIDRPDETTRRAIFAQKAQARDLTLSDEVLTLLVACETLDVRAIEGITGRLAALVNLGGLHLTPALVREELRDHPRHSSAAISLNDIAVAVADAWQISVVDLTGRKRTKTLALARKIAVHLSRRLTRSSLREIAECYANRSHATIHDTLKHAVAFPPDATDLRAQLKTALRLLGQDETPEVFFPQQQKLF